MFLRVPDGFAANRWQLNPWWLSLLMHIYVTLLQCVKYNALVHTQRPIELLGTCQNHNILCHMHNSPMLHNWVLSWQNAITLSIILPTGPANLTVILVSYCLVVVNNISVVIICISCEANMTNCVVSTVPADGLASLDARPSAGTVMTKFGFQICMGLTH